MSRPMKWFIAPVLASVLAVGCGGDEAAAPEVVEAQESALSTELLDTTWPVLMATEAGFGPYAAKSGWISLVMQRDVRAAVERLGPDAGPTGARVHTEAAFVYRQAALLAAHALIETLWFVYIYRYAYCE